VGVKGEDIRTLRARRPEVSAVCWKAAGSRPHPVPGSHVEYSVHVQFHVRGSPCPWTSGTPWHSTSDGVAKGMVEGAGGPYASGVGRPNGLPSAMFSNTLNNVQRVERCISLRRGQRGVQRSRQRQNDAVGGPSPGRRVSGRSWTVVRLSAGTSAQGTKPVKMAWTQVDRLLSHGSMEGPGTKQTAAAGGRRRGRPQKG
jgi:hypothetical protein